MSLYQVKSIFFTAGFYTSDGRVTEAAPIIKYFIGWRLSRAFRYAKGKNWKVEKVKRHEAKAKTRN